MSYYLVVTIPAPASGDFLVTEDGDFLITEDGDFLIIE